MRTFYVIINFKMRDGIPVFHEAGIYGEFPLTRYPSTRLDVQLKAFEIDGRDYQEASDNAVAAMKASPLWNWLVPHVEKTSS